MKTTYRTICIVATFGWTCVPQTNAVEPDRAPTAAADSMCGKAPGEARDDNGLKMQLVWCSPGFLKMENFEIYTERAPRPPDRISDDDFDRNDMPAAPLPPRQFVEFTAVKVFLTKGYWLGKYEVTQSEWKRVMKTEPWRGQDATEEGADFPAIFVDWQGAADFCRILTVQERQAGRLPDGWEYTLPTEAQSRQVRCPRSQSAHCAK